MTSHLLVSRFNTGVPVANYFIRACLIVVLNILDWERMSPSTGPGAMFYQFCDALEVKDGQIADQNGWGLEHAIQAWGGFFNASYTHYSKSYFRATNGSG